MATIFHQLTDDWNADPNVPDPTVEIDGPSVILRFWLNSFLFERFAERDWGQIVFENCWRYRLGGTNDEGWYRDQCRFSKMAPQWGEFYEIEGDLLLDATPPDQFGQRKPLVWTTVSDSPISGSRHFLFYFRDQTFECDASDWTLTFHSEERPR
jgi:hypothetical protein